MRQKLILAAILASVSVAVAEPPRSLEFSGNQFMVKAKVTRYLCNGSGIEHSFASVQAKNVCNGWNRLETGQTLQTCAIQLQTPKDLEFDYRIKQYDQQGTLVLDILCQPMENSWACGTTRE